LAHQKSKFETRQREPANIPIRPLRAEMIQNF
jgi:hypothetical protein